MLLELFLFLVSSVVLWSVYTCEKTQSYLHPQVREIKNEMGISENWRRLQAKQGIELKPEKPVKPKKAKKPRHPKPPTKTEEPKQPVKPTKAQPQTQIEKLLWELDNARNKLATGKYVALDCEFVGVGPSDESALARVSIVNLYGHVLLDTFVKPQERVTDWRTWVSGVRPKDMRDALPFKNAQQLVKNILKDKKLVGHALSGDLKCLKMDFPKRDIRDTSKYSLFRQRAKGRAPSLKRLVLDEFNLDIQSGQHSSIEDARACMLLYRVHKAGIDSESTQR